MSELERGHDHPARRNSLLAFQAYVDQGSNAGLAQLGSLQDEPVRIHTALQILAQDGRFQDAIDLAAELPKHCKWIDMVVYVLVAEGRIDNASEYLQFADETCTESHVQHRCRIAVADAAFSEVLNDTAGFGLTADRLTETERRILEFVIHTLAPLTARARLFGRADTAIERMAVEFAANAHGLLGQLSEIAELVRPIERSRPVPILLAQLTLRRMCPPPTGLPGRLRVEHPQSFHAHFLAAILDREAYERPNEALTAMLRLEGLAHDEGTEAATHLSQGLFETASALGTSDLAKARLVVDRLLGSSNQFHLYFDAVALLHQEKPDAALAELEKDRREDDGIWWQIAGKAHELADRLERAAECWGRACSLMPHPSVLNHFAGLSIHQRHFDKAIEALEALVEQSPDDERTLEQLAFAHTRLRQFGKAGVVFEKLIAKKPEEPRYRLNVAICRARSGDPEAALEALDSPALDDNLNLDAIGVRTEILNSRNRAPEAFDALYAARMEFSEDPRFLLLLMNTAYRAGKDRVADETFRQLLDLQISGKLKGTLFHSATLDDFKRFADERRQQRESLMTEIVRGRMPWLFADALLNGTAVRSWSHRTQQLNWLPEDTPTRGEFNTYATNGFSALHSTGRSIVERMIPPARGPVVVDMSALLTLHALERLSIAARYFEKMVVPASYGDLHLADSQKLGLHQVSRETELKAIRAVVDKKHVALIDDNEKPELPCVDEYGDGDEHFGLADVRNTLAQAQILTTEQISGLDAECRRTARQDRQLSATEEVVMDLGSLRRLTTFDWFERVLPSVSWSIRRSDYDDMVAELREFAHQRTLHERHQKLWDEIKGLERAGLIEFKDSDSCRRFREEGAGNERGDHPPYMDAPFLANDLRLPLLADDRVCQVIVLNHRPTETGAACGTDLLLLALGESNDFPPEEVVDALLQLIRWRYRFLLLTPEQLKCIAERSHDSLPGPELREVAAYVQESMCDPGLFCGQESADLPTPMAFKYHMAWKQISVDFLALMWADESVGSDELVRITRWCIGTLLPAVPRGLLYSPIGHRLARMTPRAFLLMAFVHFTRVHTLARANLGLRTIAASLDITDEEFYAIAAEAADAQHI